MGQYSLLGARLKPLLVVNRTWPGNQTAPALAKPNATTLRPIWVSEGGEDGDGAGVYFRALPTY